jgi:Bacterial conjugation TrbI-like protein/Type IV conjugative transfer system lipoprotein (TraV)
VHLPAGSFVKATLLSGVYAPTRAQQPLPVLLPFTEAPVGPNATRVPLRGCVAVARALGDYTTKRAGLQLDTMSCVLPSGRAVSQPVTGWVAGPDGVFGMPGELVEREGPYLARVSLAGFLHGASAAFAAAQTTTSIGALGNTTTTITGNEALYGALSGFANTAQPHGRLLRAATRGAGPRCLRAERAHRLGRHPGRRDARRGRDRAPARARGRPPVARTRLIVLLLGAGFAGACAGHVPAEPSVPMDAALERATAASRVPLGDSLRAGLQGPGTFGTGQPGAPVLVPPDVRRVWVPTHENAEGALIAGHWVFLRVRDFRWFLEAPPARDAAAAGRHQERRELGRGPAAGAPPVSGVPWVEVPSTGTGDGPRVPASGPTGAPSVGPAPGRPVPTPSGR